MSSFHRILRDTTRQEHEILDQRLSLLDLALVQSYGAFLNIHYAALHSLRAAWRPADTEEFGTLLQLLRSDLASLGATVEERNAPLSVALTPAQRLGVSYVVRGSRLGSAVLSRRVPASSSKSYLTHQPVVSWPEFLKELESQAEEIGASGQAHVIDGAKLAFNAFDTAADAATAEATQPRG